MAASCAVFAADQPQGQAGAPASAAELSPAEKAVLKVKIAALFERYDHGDESAKIAVQREFDAMAADVVRVLLEDACTGERSPQRDRRLYMVLGFGARKQHTVEQLYPVLSADPSRLCWGPASALMETFRITERNVDARITERRVDILTKLLAHPDTRVQVQALQDLQYLGEKAAPAAEAIAVHLADKNDCVRHPAGVALANIGRPAVPVLVKALDHKQASVRRLAAETLGRIKLPAQDAVPALIARLKDSSPRVRTASLEALQRIGAPKEQIIEAISSSLGDEDPDVREKAVWSLSYIGHDAKATAPLLKKQRDNDNDEAVRYAAGRALKSIGPTTVIEYLVTYYYCILFVILTGLVFRLFFWGRPRMLKMLYGFIPACFGHPIYITLAAYITYRVGLLTEKGGNVSELNAIAFITALLGLFLLRYAFFLFIAWMNTRSALPAVVPHATDAYFKVHRYCVFGLLWFAAWIGPLEGNVVGFVYYPLILLTGAAGIVQSLVSLFHAIFPERWAPPDEIAVEHKKEGVDRSPLAPEETRQRRVAGALMGCLVLLAVAAGAALQASAREKDRGQEEHFQQMLAREKPGSAQYHLMLGQSYSGFYPVNPRIDLKEGYARALVEYNKAIELDPNLAWAYKQRAHAYSAQNDHERAVKDFNTFEKLSDVVDWNLYASRARAYKALGMYDRMCEDRLKECCGDYSRDSYKKLVEEGLCKY